MFDPGILVEPVALTREDSGTHPSTASILRSPIVVCIRYLG
jgi:hypothetical protein